MNVFGFAVGIFSKRLAKPELNQVQSNGEQDGVAAAEAYCDGFINGAQKVFADRLTQFQALTVQPVDEPTPDEVEVIEAIKPALPRRPKTGSKYLPTRNQK